MVDTSESTLNLDNENMQKTLICLDQNGVWICF